MTPPLTPLQKALNKMTKAYADLACYAGDDLGEYERLAHRWTRAVDTFLDLEEQEYIRVYGEVP